MRRSSRKSTMGVTLHQSLDSDSFTRATTRRSSFFVPPPDESRTTVGNFTTKFSMSSFVKKVEDLTPQQRIAIENVGFGRLLRLPHHTLRKNLLVEWMERWDCEKGAFLLLDRELTITPLDVALILGLRGTGKPITFSSEEPISDLEEEYGADIDNRKISLSSVESRLQSLGESSNEDFVRTFLLFTLGTILFPNSNGKIDSRYLSILQNLSEVSNYRWGVAVIQDLYGWLTRKKEEQIKSMEGCLILLQIWSYEHIDVGRPNLLSEPSGLPRACRWEGSKSNTPRHLITTKFQELDDDQVLWKLQPVEAEMNVRIIKELLVAENEGNKTVKLQHLNATMAKVPRTSTQCRGLPPKNFSQLTVDEKKKKNEREGKQELQADYPENSSITEASAVTSDYLECSSSYVMQEVVEERVSETSFNFKEDHHALKAENSKLKLENVELGKVNDMLKKQLNMIPELEETIARLRTEITDLQKENTNLWSAADFIEELKRITPDELGGRKVFSEDDSF